MQCIIMHSVRSTISSYEVCTLTTEVKGNLQSIMGKYTHTYTSSIKVKRFISYLYLFSLFQSAFAEMVWLMMTHRC